jgi:hypothetical protein
VKLNKRIRAKTRDNAFISRMPAGIAGTLSRSAAQSTVDTVNLTPNGAAGAFPAYGLGGLIDAVTGNFRLPAVGDAAITGVLVRPFPTNNSQDGLGTSTPPTKGLADRLLRGYISVLLSGPTLPVKDGPVWVRIQNPIAGKFVGGFEAAADGANTVVVVGSRFSGPPDASGVTELLFNI